MGRRYRLARGLRAPVHQRRHHVSPGGNADQRADQGEGGVYRHISMIGEVWMCSKGLRTYFDAERNLRKFLFATPAMPSRHELPGPIALAA